MVRTAVRLLAIATIAAGASLISGCSSDLQSAGGTLKADTVKAFLATADSEWHADVNEDENQTLSRDARCYLVADSGAEQFRGSMACGPIRRLGSPDRGVWDTIAVETTPSGDGAGLQMPDIDEAEQSQPRPHDSSLWRPDGKEPPADSDKLAAPEAPRADPGLVTVLDQVSNGSVQPVSISITNPDYMVNITGIGSSDRVGQDRLTRRPADGEKFVVARFTSRASDDSIQQNGSRQATNWSVVVGSNTRSVRVVPDGTVDGARKFEKPQYLVVSVPTEATDVLLSSKNEGVAQSVSLLHGRRTTPDVATAYYRPKVEADLTATMPVKRIKVGTADATYSIGLKKARLTPWDMAKGWAPAGSAWLRLTYTEDTDVDRFSIRDVWNPNFFTVRADGRSSSGTTRVKASPPMKVATAAILVPADIHTADITVTATATYMPIGTSWDFPTGGRINFGTLGARVEFR